ncbi:3-oxoadipyl-CoA thiolase [Rhizorhabdus sp.]|uniref:3-oxoadipyl-CoA thiolase n=1 Tax=Rhizorhabdus sp. TaxID=1968843 RepID=UPI0003FE4160|nr:3-oxoadipyl-CoA thiolase [Rhizorhabdus sp.]MBP8234690.1 3-oxoadipyl-CoA thiolase [Rhizorhabdus sp.]
MAAAFLCGGLRTPIGRHGGALASIRADDLAAIPIRALLAQSLSLDPAAIDEVILGCANQAGEDNRNVARMAALLGGLPPSVPGVTINRLCASGLDAVAAAARAVMAGEADVVIAGGVESMTRAPFVVGKAAQPWQRSASIEDTSIGWRFVNPAMRAAYGVDSMPETGENVADQFGIARDDQDGFALRSQQRAGAAAAWHQGEITPVAIPGHKGADALVVTTDEHPRPATTAEQLARLKPVVRPSGTVTAGNASGINDGAAALLVASEAGIARHGLTPIARIMGAASAGVEPRIMGIGPVPATQRLMARLGLTVDQFAVIELNEAFASQALATLRELGIPDDAPHVNPHGGAIALGHPLGMSGARLVLTAARALTEADGDYALCTMCVGVGQGVALALGRM